ncbi:pyruvate kinase [Clostridium uliginosum]|uniref:Pyruvate kinase n=1 Tax=Clostridium uliginosum TaxID=119641 RepID=A0A1I1RTA8_9CLOT|nr:pyruvate kinase [Clostridium uliginosum]SFD37352.1 pyruvate kinase [Clostridium uliginosum]
MYIIATVGPNIKEKKVLKEIVYNGANALRLNFSHGSNSEFLEYLKMAREIKKDIVIILDLSGNKIRVSNSLMSIYKIYDGEEVYFCGEDKYEEIKNKIHKNSKIIPLNIKNKVLKENEYNQISIKDNTMLFNVFKRENDLIKASTVTGGVIRGGKGCNIKGLDREYMNLSKKDKDDIEFGIRNKVDIICQSFVETEKDIEEVIKVIDTCNVENYKPKIWAKIETLKGVNNIKNIASKVDGIVIARGDLIPETSIEDTPIYENKIIKDLVKSNNKEIIIATHVLNSMKSGKIASISEVESIYHFIKNGVTGFLLAGETSIGRAPIKTVKFLNELIEKYYRNDNV